MAEPFETLELGIPIVLLPVRLETRWFARSAAEHELRVRIFPDALHIGRLREPIRQSEQIRAIEYWRLRLGAEEESGPALSTWNQLAGTLGVPRAAWLVKTLEPRIGAGGVPEFPDVEVVPDDAVSLDPSEAIGLPDRFVVMGFEGRTRVFAVFGSRVPASLPVGPTDLADPDLRWQVVFEAAEAVGMGVRVVIPITQAQRLTRIAVVGVREGISPAITARTLAGLIERHAVDSGAALLPAGTPTNHTGTARAGTSLRPSGVAPPAGSDGERLARALGLETDDLQFVANNGLETDNAARAMNEVLWPATWEYFLEEIAAPICSPAQKSAGRSLFINYVRARGPFPTLVLGRQPYGVLPVSPLRLWRTPQGGDDAFAGLLLNLRGRWTSASASAPSLPGDGDPTRTLVDILSMQPTSVRWLGRSAADPEIALPRWLGSTGIVLTQIQIAGLRAGIVSELTALGFPAESAAQIEPMIFESNPFDVDLALASRRGLVRLLPSTNPSIYLNAIAGATPQALRAHEIAGSQPRTLLYLLVRHAMLRVLVRTAEEAVLTAAERSLRRREQRVFLNRRSTVWSTLDRRAERFGGQPISEVLARPDLPDRRIFRVLRSYRSALRLLAATPPAEVERLAAEGIDLASHRLDAWTTALATSRLFETRAGGARGVHLGAYGWVEGGSPPAEVASANAPIKNSSGHGFVHAPSLEHARTAAVLRAGFVARPTPDLAIDLSSDRVRRAKWLLAQTSAGESLAAVLGYRIERLLVESSQGHLIADLRKQFGLAESASGEMPRPKLDGLKVHQFWVANRPAEESLAAVADSIAELVDALSDLLLAESVHQQVNGNPTRVAQVLDALEAGSKIPNDPQVVQSPVPTDQTTWQVVLSLDPSPQTPAHAGWAAAAVAARAAANPLLERWAGTLLPSPESLAATIRLVGQNGAEQTVPVAVSTLELCALDFVALCGNRFESSPLAAILAAEAPTEAVAAAGKILVEPNPALLAGHTVAGAVQRAIRAARPYKPGAGQQPSAALSDRRASALAAIHRDRNALDQPGSRRRSAALTLAPFSADLTLLRLDDLVAQLTGASPEDSIRQLCGLPAEAEGEANMQPSGDDLASAGRRTAWLSDVGCVRPAIEALEILALAHRNHAGTELPVSLWQPSEGSNTENKKVVLIGVPPANAVLHGLVLDEWKEAIPRGEVTSGLAFHAESPSTRAPQSILIAVPPDPSKKWSLDVLDETIREVIDLSFVRLARPSGVWGTLLPAIYLAENLEDDTVSTPLADSAVTTILES